MIGLRKLFACIFGEVILTGLYVLTLLLYPEAPGIIFVTALVLIVTVIFAYIGGNVWSKWVTSKYFRGDNHEKNHRMG